jgi:hypothetical protein
VGLGLFITLFGYLIAHMKKYSNTSNDNILFTVIVIICYCVTDNFLYFTFPLLIVMFIASSADAYDHETKEITEFSFQPIRL